MRQRILISNDDGVNARGLAALIEVAVEFGDVTVVAPEAAMSGMSHAITMNTPIFLRTIKQSNELSIYACNGTPADCIKMASDYIMPQEPTLVLSGINHGNNSNICSLYSGTMGAALEGSMYGIPAIGFSLDSHSASADFEASKLVVRRVIRSIIEKNIQSALCLNVNIPNVPYSEIKGIISCRQATGVWKEEFIKHTNPRGVDYFWLTGDFAPHQPEATDVDDYHLAQNYVTVVPIQPDMTDHAQLEKMKNWKF